tara:strand:- start:1191 stop:1355 length:165 start_codon:yes stop_codon:yes gene_type:complete
MTKLESSIAYKKYFAKGGKITKCRPSNKMPEPKRYSYSVFNKGRKSFTVAGELV